MFVLKKLHHEVVFLHLEYLVCWSNFQRFLREILIILKWNIYNRFRACWINIFVSSLQLNSLFSFDVCFKNTPSWSGVSPFRLSCLLIKLSTFFYMKIWLFLNKIFIIVFMLVESTFLFHHCNHFVHREVCCNCFLSWRHIPFDKFFNRLIIALRCCTLFFKQYLMSFIVVLVE